MRATIFQTLQRSSHEYNEGAGSNNERLLWGLSHSLGVGKLTGRDDMDEIMGTSKLNFSYILFLIGSIIIFSSYFFNEAICLIFVLGSIFLLLGLLLMLSAGVESLQELKKGNKDPTVISTAFLVIFLVGFSIINIIVPDSQELYYDATFIINWVIILLLMRKKLKQ